MKIQNKVKKYRILGNLDPSEPFLPYITFIQVIFLPKHTSTLYTRSSSLWTFPPGFALQALLELCWLFKETVDKTAGQKNSLRGPWDVLSPTWSSSSTAPRGTSPWQRRWVGTPRHGRIFPGSGTRQCQQKEGQRNLWGVERVKISAFSLKWQEVNVQQIMCCFFFSKSGVLSTDAPGPIHCTIPTSDFAFQLMDAFFPPLNTLLLTNPFALHRIFATHLK